MDSDIEMIESKSAPTLVTSVSLPVLPPSDSQQVSPIAPDIDDSSPSAAPDEPSPPDVVPKISTDSKGKSKPASGKPKSTKARARSPSPSPPPLVPPPPLQTVRLEIKLGGPENYEVDVAALAKATGQRPASPPAAVKRYESESDGEGEGAPESGAGSDGGGEKKTKKVRKARYIRSRNETYLIESHRVRVMHHLEEEEESGHGVLRLDGPVHRRLGTRDRRAHVHRTDEAAGVLRLLRRGRVAQGKIAPETQVEEVRAARA